MTERDGPDPERAPQTLPAPAMRSLLGLLAAALAGLLLLGLVVTSKPYFPIAGIFGFEAWFGLATGLGFILAARLWAALFRRGETFYDE